MTADGRSYDANQTAHNMKAVLKSFFTIYKEELLDLFSSIEWFRQHVKPEDLRRFMWEAIQSHGRESTNIFIAFQGIGERVPESYWT